MKVWLLMYHDYDDVAVIGVYATEARAQHAEKTEDLGKWRNRSNCYISEAEVEE